MRISNDEKSTSHTSNMEEYGGNKNELHLKPGKKTRNGDGNTEQKGIEKLRSTLHNGKAEMTRFGENNRKENTANQTEEKDTKVD